MDSITIDFNDDIYMATGIQAASIAVRETTIRGENDSVCRLFVTKRHVGKKVTFYIAMKNSRGESVLDIQAGLVGQILTIDKAISQDAIVIENVEELKLRKGIELHSDQEKVNILLRIKLEKPLPAIPLKRVRKHTAQTKKTRTL